jgi:hypothetical protein
MNWIQLRRQEFAANCSTSAPCKPSAAAERSSWLDMLLLFSTDAGK